MRSHTVFAPIAFLLLGTAISPAAAYDTINCERDRNPAERAICSNQRLQVLDARVTEAYTDIMLDGHIRSSVKDAVRESQQNFLKHRDACGRDPACLAEVMSLRASRINFYR